jgi:hypothetical protein
MRDCRTLSLLLNRLKEESWPFSLLSETSGKPKYWHWSAYLLYRNGAELVAFDEISFRSHQVKLTNRIS